MSNSRCAEGLPEVSGNAHNETKRKRVVTVARKEQNRAAQRLYRERQKLRQQALRKKQQERPCKQLEVRPRITPSCDQSKQTLDFDDSQRLSLDQGYPMPTSLEEDIAGLHTYTSCALSSHATPDSDHMCHQQQPFHPIDVSLQSQLPFVQSYNVSETLWSLPSADTSYPLPRVPGLALDTQMSRDPQVNGIPLSTLPFPYLMVHELAGDTSSIHSALNNSRSVSTSISQLQSLGDTEVSASLLSSLSQPPSLTDNSMPQANPYHLYSGDSPRPFADPYLNTLQLAFSRTFSAFLHNACSLGFSISDLLGGGSGGCDCGGPGFQSPFYRPDAATHCNPSELLAAAVASRPSIPQHLRPTLPQILFPHHAFLDLLPFPALRARAITLSAAKPRAFDAMRLKKDIYTHQALVCWLEREDNGARSPGINGHPASQPWDMRSWKVAPWFLRKWKMLISGEEAKLWQPGT